MKRSHLQAMIQTLWYEVANMHIPCSFEMASIYVFLHREENMANQA